MPRRLKAVLFALFAVTGFSALTLQVVWQRVITMHAGVDLFSFTTVVSAFLAGLGIGSLAGGALADRLGPRRSLLAFACSNAGIGIFAWLSIRLFYDGYRAMVPHISGTLGAFLFHFALLLVPTVLMGLSLPLVSRGIVDRVQDAGPLVGRLYAINTLGAGFGAAVSGWLLLGNLGFRGSVRAAGTLNLLAAALVLSLWRTASRMPEEAEPAVAEEAPVAAGDERAAWPWFVIYGLTGAVALGLEVVFFRTIDGLMRSNSYTFAHVLTLYLLLFGTGAAIASRVVARVQRPERWFLGLQFGVGVAALAGLFALVQLPGLLGIDGPLRRHFAIDGYNLGNYDFWPPRELARMAFVHLIGPLMVMGAPVLLMGSAFPFAQALVARRIDTLGRQTGRLLFSNIVGNVVGTLVVGFVLVDRIGTSGVFRLLAALLLIPGLAAAAMAGDRTRRALLAGGAVLVMGGALAAFPSNYKLWSFLHSAQETDFSLAEDRACVNALRRNGDEYLLFINGASQNGYPYDDYHVLIGLLPALMHPDPTDAMAVGLGIGATPYGMLLDERLESIDVVELCGGELDLLRSLADGGSRENQRLFAEDRMDIHVGDGRKWLLKTDERFDVMTVDVIRPQAAFSGSLYSVEFYELVRSRLAEGGVFAQWLPSDRTANGVTEVFEHVLAFTVPTYHDSQFFLASNQPLTYDGALLQQRLDALMASASGQFTLPEGRLQSIRKVLGEARPVPLRSGELTAEVGGDQVNRDLFPRDEYFLNNPVVVPRRPAPET
ncbi:MAG: fused MFS/spermidine synthase [Acidimicrobiia bacterium]